VTLAAEGTVFGRYRLLESIGSGGMAVVYRAIVDGPLGFSRSIVVKRVLPEYSRDASFVRMLVEEARLSALLHHPSIAQVHELGQVGGEYYLTMEHVDGWDLSALLRRSRDLGRPLAPGLVCYLIAEVASALAYAHDLRDTDGRPLQIIHRDISPSNVMVSKAGSVKLLDFGIAKAADHIRDEHTRTGALKGKISYLSPEQAEGDPVDRRSDIFALGIVMHECLTGQRLFQGSDDFRTLRMVRNAEARPPSALRQGIDPDVDAVTMKMLARKPEDRYQDCDQLSSELAPIVHRLQGDAGMLRRFVRELGAGAAQAGPGSSPRAAVVEPRTETQGEKLPVPPAPATRGGPRRISWTVGAVAVLIAAGASIAGWRWAGSKPPSPPAPISAAAPAPRPIAAPSRVVTLLVEGTDGAEVSIDGKVVGLVPCTVTLPRGSGARALTLRRSGYKTFTGEVTTERDVNLHVVLLAQPKRAARARPASEIENPFGP